jgi:vesicle-fusing ATPase
MYGEVGYVTDKAAPRELAASDIIDRLLKDFSGQILTAGQQVVFELQGLNLRLNVASLLVTDAGTGESADVRRALLSNATAFIFTNAGQAPIKVTGQKGFATNQLFKSRALSFEALGIGGLDAQFESIFRRAFASRVFPPSILERLGIQHVKGMLLYGPPGTGKTLIARQIGKMLNGKEPKVVNGPEVLSKYVGQAEENIRNLFGEAEAEYRDKGDQSVRLGFVVFGCGCGGCLWGARLSVGRGSCGPMPLLPPPVSLHPRIKNHPSPTYSPNHHHHPSLHPRSCTSSSLTRSTRSAARAARCATARARTTRSSTSC